MSKSVTSGFAVFAVVFIAAGQAAAQALPSALLECRTISDDVKRLACLDQTLDRLIEASERSAKSGSDVGAGSAIAAVEKPVLSEQDDFGIEDLPAEKKKKLRAEKPKLLEAIVVDIARNRRGKYVIVLDNGQVWRQLNADTNKLRVPKNSAGLTVKIKRKLLGAHDLSLENSNRTIRVERIK